MVTPRAPRRRTEPPTRRWSEHVRTLLVTAFAAAALAVPASAQDTPLFSLGGGLTVPSGDADERFDTGFGVLSTGVFPIGSRLGIEVGAYYNRLHADDDLALVALGFDPDSFTQGGGFLEGGYRWAAGLTAGLRVDLGSRERRVVPHVSAGAGAAKAGTHEIRTLYLGESETYPGSSDMVFMASGGAGVDVGLSPGVSAFAAARYVLAFTDPERTSMMPITLGLSLRLEER